MAKVGLITFSDGRDFAYAHTRDFCIAAERRLVAALEGCGHNVVCARSAVGSNEQATSEARAIAAQHPDVTMFHYPVWAFPHFSMLAAGPRPVHCCSSPTSTPSNRAWSGSSTSVLPTTRPEMM